MPVIPNLANATVDGWSGIGRIHHHRLRGQFKSSIDLGRFGGVLRQRSCKPLAVFRVRQAGKTTVVCEHRCFAPASNPSFRFNDLTRAEIV